MSDVSDVSDDYTATVELVCQPRPTQGRVEFILYVALYHKGKQFAQGRLDTFESEPDEIGDEVVYGGLYYYTKHQPLRDGQAWLDELSLERSESPAEPQE